MKSTLPTPFQLDESSLGPAMLALTPPRRLFVIGKTHLGLSDKRAGEFAGYKSVVTSWRTAHREDVQAAIAEEGHKLLRAQGAASIRTIVEIRDDKKADARDRLKAAIELMNRSGFHAVTESHSVVEHKLSEAQMDKRILALAAELGMSEEEAKKMLIAPAEFQKNAAGVYVDVSEARPVEEPEPEAEPIEEPGEIIEVEPEPAPDAAFEASLQPIKRGRGRPRKIDPLAGLEELF